MPHQRLLLELRLKERGRDARMCAPIRARAHTRVYTHVYTHTQVERESQTFLKTCYKGAALSLP